ncbi:MAG: response regulator [Bdellovibrionales bacterium]|nr:response regulator [Ramlibacter sp.]
MRILLRLKNFGRNLTRSYRLHHESNPSLLHWIGLIGFVALSAFFLARLTGKLPPRWDDLPFRIPGILFCFLLILRRWWPEPLVRFYLPYSYFTAFYCLAFFLPLTLLENGGAPNTVANMMLGAGLVVLVTDWRNTLLMIVGGYLAAAGVYLAHHPLSAFPMEFLYWWVPLCMVMVAGGTASKYVERRAELERLRHLYAGLAGSIAHEVRNPMAQVQYALEGALSILSAARTSEPPALARRQVDALAQALAGGALAVARGLQAVTLTLQQVSGKPLDSASFTRLSAAECVEKALAEFAFETAEQRACVGARIEGDFMFHGDETACVLVLFNLLKNALYYLPVHPQTRVTLTVQNAPQCRIVVHDTGPGVPPVQVAELFEEFYSFGKAEGTGLGLAFCARVMSAFGGDISCRSDVGEFTEFVLAFPPALAPQPADEPITGVAGSAAHSAAPAESGFGKAEFIGRAAMVVDDSAFNRSVLKARLRDLGMVVQEARHGEEALQMLDHGARPEVILMDMQMPGISGMETTRALRARPAPLNSIPVLAVSANDLQRFRDNAVEAGVDGYLAKPLQSELLRRELARVLAEQFEPGQNRRVS